MKIEYADDIEEIPEEEAAEKENKMVLKKDDFE